MEIASFHMRGGMQKQGERVCAICTMEDASLTADCLFPLLHVKEAGLLL